MSYEQRDYQRENEVYHSRPDQVRDRVSRNRARRMAREAGLVPPARGHARRSDVEIHHINDNPLDNHPDNWAFASNCMHHILHGDNCRQGAPFIYFTPGHPVYKHPKARTLTPVLRPPPPRAKRPAVPTARAAKTKTRTKKAAKSAAAPPSPRPGPLTRGRLQHLIRRIEVAKEIQASTPPRGRAATKRARKPTKRPKETKETAVAPSRKRRRR